MKNLLIIILVFLVVGCSTKQKIVESTSSKTTELTDAVTKERDSLSSLLSKVRKERDSISVETERVIIPETEVGTTISNPCDSLGNLKNAEYNLSGGKNNVKVVIKDNKIDIKSITESVTSEVRKEYREKSVLDSIALSEFKDRYHRDSISHVKEVEILKSKLESKVRYKTRWWVWLLLISSVSLNVFLVKKVGAKSLFKGVISFFKP